MVQFAIHHRSSICVHKSRAAACLSEMFGTREQFYGICQTILLKRSENLLHYLRIARCDLDNGRAAVARKGLLGYSSVLFVNWSCQQECCLHRHCRSGLERRLWTQPAGRVVWSNTSSGHLLNGETVTSRTPFTH